MLSPEFARSVILVIEHNDMMTFGVDLTKRSEVAIFNVLPEWLPVVAKPQALYIGGPLNQQSVVGLAQTNQGVDPDKHDRLTRLAPRLAHVDLRAEPEEIEPLVSGMRMFAGYAEWGGPARGGNRGRRMVRLPCPRPRRYYAGPGRPLVRCYEAPTHAVAAVLHLPRQRGRQLIPIKLQAVGYTSPHA